jgi:ATP-binding cassette subfamily F protein 3
LEKADAYTAESRAAQLLAGLGFSASEQRRTVNEFSGGWRMRLSLARTLMQRSDILLLDEPTNHLDLDAIIWLESWLKKYRGALLLISHDRDFLDNVCTHIAHIEQQKIDFYTGNYSAFEAQRAARLANVQAAYLKQQSSIAHMQKFVDRFRAQATKAKQAQSRLKALSRMESIAPAHIDSPFSFQFTAPDKNPRQLLTVANVNLGYGETTILSAVKMRLESGARIGLLGANGAGKSTLIKALAGTLEAMSGEIDSAKELNIGYFAQHQLEQLRHDDTPLSHLSRLHPQASESELRNFLGGFGFAGTMALSPVAPMSGGEKARLVLATLVRQKPNLLLLDEPTNHLDLQMRYALNIALQSFEGALVVVSHDRHLLQTVTDELWLVADGKVQPYPDDLDAYARWLLKSRSEAAALSKEQSQESAASDTLNEASANSSAGLSAEERKARKREEAELRQKLRPLTVRTKAIEKRIDSLESSASTIEVELSDSAIYDDANKDKLKKLLHKQGEETAELNALENEWIELNEQLEKAQQSLS